MSETVSHIKNTVKEKQVLSFILWTLWRVNYWMGQLLSVKCSLLFLLQWTQFVPTVTCRKTKRSSKWPVQFFITHLCPVSSQFYLQVLYWLVACGTKNPKAFKHLRKWKARGGEKKHKAESHRWKTRLRHLIDIGLFVVSPAICLKL